MSYKILVIDDNTVGSKHTGDVLTQNLQNVDVLVTQRVNDGFERFQVVQPDVIVLGDALPDADGGAALYRLLNDSATASVPVVLISGGENGQKLQDKYKNVVKTLAKPLTQEALLAAVNGVLEQADPKPHPSSNLLFRDYSKITFSGHTGFFSLRAALQMAYGDKLTGILRIFLNRFPVELYVLKGRFIFATTRNAHLYLRESSVILPASNLGLVIEAQNNQSVSGCPLFLFLATRSGFPHDDVVQLTRDHGQRLFANLWTAGRVNFEFEEAGTFPDYARNFPPTQEDPENWVLASLRHVKYDSLLASQRPDPNGSPAYTRKGYELIQKLKLNDVEARFATAINGSESLQNIAKKIGVPLNDALLIVFRFQTLDIIDYWSSSVLSLPASQTNPAGGGEEKK
jgi:CheY-like chemotaxis protein